MARLKLEQWTEAEQVWKGVGRTERWKTNLIHSKPLLEQEYSCETERRVSYAWLSIEIYLPLQDCSQALLLDPAYTKAHHRRGTARRKLGRVLEATEDYESALRLDPTSAAARWGGEVLLAMPSPACKYIFMSCVLNVY
jgi:tetratricopeptide (TPR) repeat protein